MSEGLLIVLSGPSGTGKGTVCGALLEKHKDIILSVSCTTRSPRAGEKEGINYFFTSRERFEQLIEKDEFLEHAEVFSNYYGTPKSFVDQNLSEGKDVLLEIDVQGALSAKQSFAKGVYIFLIPPSMNELENRIRSRGTEDEEQIQTRLGKAQSEMQLIDKYDYVIVNDKVQRVIESIESILHAEKLKVSRNNEKINFIRNGE